MRRYLIIPALVATVLAGYVTFDRAAQAQDMPVQGGSTARSTGGGLDTAELRTDLEVLRRILSRRVLGRDGTSGARTALMTAWVMRADGGDVDVDFVKGDGLVVNLSVAFEVNPPRARQQEGEEAQEPTLWEEVLADVEGRERASGPTTPSPSDYDADKVAALEKSLFETLGAYAGHVRALTDTDHVTVIVRGRSRMRTVTTLADVVTGAVVDPNDLAVGGGAGGQRYTKGQVVRLTTGVEASHWTVRMRVSDLRRVAEGVLTVESLRKASM